MCADVAQIHDRRYRPWSSYRSHIRKDRVAETRFVALRPEDHRMSQRLAPTHPETDKAENGEAEIARLKQEVFLLETLMDNSPDSIYFKDLNSRFTRINRYAATRFGVEE